MNQYLSHKKAKELLRSIVDKRSLYLVIHYSCESFKDKEDGRTPRITTIAIRHLDSSQTKAFSIHEVAEQRQIPMSKIEENYNMLELEMLRQYFEFINQHTQYFWIHWNMRDSNYGFYAIESRYRVLGGTPTPILDAQKIDLSRLLVDIYGRNYIDHPRMEKLIDINGMTKLGFLSGAQEAEAFEKKEYIKLRNSTLRKVELFSNISCYAADRTLKTKATLKDIYGLSIQGIYEGLKEKWWFNITVFIIGIVIGVIVNP